MENAVCEYPDRGTVGSALLPDVAASVLYRYVAVVAGSAYGYYLPALLCGLSF